MATGDQGNIVSRLLALLPPSWFPIDAPNVNAAMQGFGKVGVFAYNLIAFAKLQTRISSSTGFFLDLIAFDYFGRYIRRRVSELDAAFLARIKKELVRPRVTRAAMIEALTDLTGSAPIIFEPWSPQDAGGYGVACGYGVAGGYGNAQLHSQVFITVQRPGLQGVPGVGGYGSSIGGYGLGSIEYIGPGSVVEAVTDADIYATIEATKPTGVICWTKLV